MPSSPTADGAAPSTISGAPSSEPALLLDQQRAPSALASPARTSATSSVTRRDSIALPARLAEDPAALGRHDLRPHHQVAPPRRARRARSARGVRGDRDRLRVPHGAARRRRRPGEADRGDHAGDDHRERPGPRPASPPRLGVAVGVAEADGDAELAGDLGGHQHLEGGHRLLGGGDRVRGRRRPRSPSRAGRPGPPSRGRGSASRRSRGVGGARSTSSSSPAAVRRPLDRRGRPRRRASR